MGQQGYRSGGNSGEAIRSSQFLTQQQADANSIVNSISNVTITILSDSRLDFPLDTEAGFIQYASGTVTVQAGEDVVLLGGPISTTGIGGVIEVWKVARNTWVVALPNAGVAPGGTEFFYDEFPIAGSGPYTLTHTPTAGGLRLFTADLSTLPPGNWSLSGNQLTLVSLDTTLYETLQCRYS